MPNIIAIEDHLGEPPGEERLAFLSLNLDFCSVKMSDFIGLVEHLNVCKMTKNSAGTLLLAQENEWSLGLGNLKIFGSPNVDHQNEIPCYAEQPFSVSHCDKTFTNRHPVRVQR